MQQYLDDIRSRMQFIQFCIHVVLYHQSTPTSPPAIWDSPSKWLLTYGICWYPEASAPRNVISSTNGSVLWLPTARHWHQSSRRRTSNHSSIPRWHRSLNNWKSWLCRAFIASKPYSVPWMYKWRTCHKQSRRATITSTPPRMDLHLHHSTRRTRTRWIPKY